MSSSVSKCDTFAYSSAKTKPLDNIQHFSAKRKRLHAELN